MTQSLRRALVVVGNTTQDMPPGDVLDGGVPPGAMVYVAASTAPAGFLKANGAAVSRNTYANLYAAIGTIFGTGDGSTTFNVPDLRGQFMRAWVDNGSIDSGRTLGSSQAQNMPSHYHRLPSGQSGSTTYLGVDGNGLSVFGSEVGSGSFSVVSGSASASGSERIAYTEAVANGQSGDLRPANVAMLACIKF